MATVLRAALLTLVRQLQGSHFWTFPLFCRAASRLLGVEQQWTCSLLLTELKPRILDVVHVKGLERAMAASVKAALPLPQWSKQPS